MKQHPYKLMTFITMIPLLFGFGATNAETTLYPSAEANAIQQSSQSDAKATVLAKGQNNLPKHDRTDCPQG